ncbi:MAG: OmpH family outer membrane protein [Sporocytophaga sp.]|uniref:OmpH family outer membrane protein n=1 Tax=Sporocytophaga sp. TaxID=2231183 RepID=UPI001B0BAA89|nr:OmpH family outer membrane protein [Sporocytophaga sp.]MBO9702039.1 OmpH family outer membrane protein [Sporocytophaga sp.]
MNNNFKVFSALFIVLFLIGGVCVYFLIPKIGYINSSKVFTEFKLKKELETDLKKLELAKQRDLDSLKAELEISYNELNSSSKKSEKDISEFKVAHQQYYIREKQYNENYQRAADQYTQQVWKQLNSFIKEFGKQEGYDFVLGANGAGEIMYADENDDLTEKVLEYCNKRYEGDIK